MSAAPIQPVAETIERSLSIKHVYGEPVSQGGLTFIPVAQVVYGFGAGGGGAQAAAAPDTRPQAYGAGGGGAVRMTPVGVLELRPEGSRFVRHRPWAPLLAAAGVGFAIGWLLSRR